MPQQKPPLQNRVHPSGEICAVAAHGTLLGNRGGRFHRDDKTLGRRRWSNTHWICCELHFKDRHHDAMGQGYTSLFFLDEVTALAAGHRPCFRCRRAEALQFAALSGLATHDLDARLHAECTAPRPSVMSCQLCDGAMVAQGEACFALRAGRFLRWSFDGYEECPAVRLERSAKLLTAPTILAILQKGYQPRWHASANL